MLELERIRLLGGVPVGWQRAVAAAWLAPGIVSRDYTTNSLFDGFRTEGIVPARADYDVRAGTAAKRQAKLLDVRLAPACC